MALGATLMAAYSLLRRQAGRRATPPRTITVVGRGEAQGKPDVVRTSLGVEAIAPDLAAAMDQASARMRDILAALRKLGIADRDLRTSNFSIYVERPIEKQAQAAPRKGPAAEDEPQALYHVSNVVEVVIRDLDRASRVLEAAVKAGANTVSGLSFALEDTKPVEARALAEAVADAKLSAASIAKLAGVSLGEVLRVSEIVGAGPMTPMRELRAAGGPPIEPGELRLSTQVQVVYAIAERGMGAGDVEMED